LLSESGSRFDLLLTVRLPETLEGAATEGEHAAYSYGTVNVTLGLLLNASDHTEGVNVTLTLSRRPSGQVALNNAAVAVNGTNTTTQWATHPCSQGRQPGTPFVYCACYPSCGARFTVYPDEAVLTLRALVDTSILEVFAQGGRAVATKRAYLSSTNREVVLWNNGGASAVVDAGDARSSKQSIPLPCISI
jgi:sucrose-6-phosphate hydrolase SacC (GH32 family)